MTKTSLMQKLGKTIMVSAALFKFTNILTCWLPSWLTNILVTGSVSDHQTDMVTTVSNHVSVCTLSIHIYQSFIEIA